jgi:acyl carrier protein
MQDIKTQLINILSLELAIPAEDIHTDSDFITDLQADSLDTANIILAVSTEFNINIPMQYATELDTVGKLLQLIESKKNIS